jgi:hypothetical protein
MLAFVESLQKGQDVEFTLERVNLLLRNRLFACKSSVTFVVESHRLHRDRHRLVVHVAAHDAQIDVAKVTTSDK